MEQDKTPKYHWYETKNGKRFLCVRLRVHGRKIIQKFEMPVGVRELKVEVVPA